LPRHHLLRKRRFSQAKEPEISSIISKKMNGVLLAERLSPGGFGCTKVIEIGGGQSTCKQSFESLALGGEIEVIGFLAHLEETGQKDPTFFESILRSATIRGLQGGNREQFTKSFASLNRETSNQPLIHVFMS
jgi:threonine dehydrogenase-like Zn-dependent dehydrogenase